MGKGRAGKLPTWAYGAAGAAYALAAGFSAVFAAPWFMSPAAHDLDSDIEGSPQHKKEVYKHDFSRLAAVSFAVAKNLGDLSETVTLGDLGETVTYPPPAPLINSGASAVAATSERAGGGTGGGGGAEGAGGGTGGGGVVVVAAAAAAAGGGARGAESEALLGGSSAACKGAVSGVVTDVWSPSRPAGYDEEKFKWHLLSKAAVTASAFCAGILLLNSRLLFGWQKGWRGKYDADAFQKAFDRFMNEKGGAGTEYRDTSGHQRSQKFKTENDTFWREFHAREEQSRRTREHFRKEREEFHKNFYRGRGGQQGGAGATGEEPHHRGRHQYDGRWGYRGHEGGEGSGKASTRHSTSDIQEALERLGIGMSASEVASKGLAAAKLKSAYIRAAKQWHPDGKGDTHKETFEKEFKRVSAAYTLLRPLCS